MKANPDSAALAMQISQAVATPLSQRFPKNTDLART